MAEKEYIEREAAKEALTGWDTDPTDEEIEYTLDNIPTADVAEVVRCKNCIYQDDCARQMVHTTRDYVLEQNISTYKKVDFCSYGERKKQHEHTKCS